jgi:hypothetical protein
MEGGTAKILKCLTTARRMVQSIVGLECNIYHMNLHCLGVCEAWIGTI